MNVEHQENARSDRTSVGHLEQIEVGLLRHQLEFFLSASMEKPLRSDGANQAIIDAMNTTGIGYLEALNSNRNSGQEPLIK